MTIDIEKSLLPMKKISIQVKEIKERSEPLHITKGVANKRLKEKTNDFSFVFSTGLRELHQVRTAIQSTYADHFSVVREW